MEDRIASVRAQQIIDCKCRPAVEVEIRTESGAVGRGAAPTGTSVGMHEAFVLRDGDPSSYNGLGVHKAVDKVLSAIGPALIGMNVFDQRAMGYATEELWFTEWEQGGTPYDVPQNYEKFNPVNHVANWSKPMLVVQGQQDFRIPVEQGLATFTALQRKGIESKLLYFPDENHWVLKPNNSIQWHDTVNAWLMQHIGQ